MSMKAVFGRPLKRSRVPFLKGTRGCLVFYGLVALLTPLTINVQNLHPNTFHKTYVDDRSWALCGGLGSRKNLAALDKPPWFEGKCDETAVFASVC